nr:cystatin-D [Symphalangus syndactylus]
MTWPMYTPLLLLTALMVAAAGSASTQSRNLAGGIHAADLNDKSVQRALDFTISEYNKDISKDEYYSRPLQVMAAYQQIVDGVNYYFNVKFGRTICTKSQSNLDNCPFNDQPKLKEEEFCSFQVNEVPKEDKISILSYKCREV